MGSKTVRFDDLLGTESSEVTQHKFTVDGVEVEPLDLLPRSFEAIEALLVKRDPDLLRAVFAPNTTPRRTPEENEVIRAAARTAQNADGSPMFDVKPTGRIPNAVETWYNTVYVPAQGEQEPEGKQATPTRRTRK